MNLTKQQTLGMNFTESSDTLTIRKADIPRLTPTNNNSAQSLFVGLLLLVLENYVGKIANDVGNIISDEYGNPIAYDNSAFFNDNLLLFPWDTKPTERAVGGYAQRFTIVVEQYAAN
jgi:hypothetical protein